MNELISMFKSRESPPEVKVLGRVVTMSSGSAALSSLHVSAATDDGIEKFFDVLTLDKDALHSRRPVSPCCIQFN